MSLSCPSSLGLGSSLSMTDHGRSIKAPSTHPNSEQRSGPSPVPELPLGWVDWAFPWDRIPAQLLPLSSPVPSFPFHRCWFQKHSVINILHVHFCLRDCFLGHSVRGSHLKPPFVFEVCLYEQPRWRYEEGQISWKLKQQTRSSRCNGLSWACMAYSAEQLKKDCLRGKTQVCMALGTCRQRPWPFLV